MNSAYKLTTSTFCSLQKETESNLWHTSSSPSPSQADVVKASVKSTRKQRNLMCHTGPYSLALLLGTYADNNGTHRGRTVLQVADVDQHYKSP